MEMSKRRVGRPKASAQTGPLVLSERRARMKVEVDIGAEVAEELAEYVRWVEVSEAMSTAEARAATVEFALRNVFKRDRLWHEWRRKREGGNGRGTSSADTATQLPQAPASPSLPSLSGARAGSATTTAVTR